MAERIAEKAPTKNAVDIPPRQLSSPLRQRSAVSPHWHAARVGRPPKIIADHVKPFVMRSSAVTSFEVSCVEAPLETWSYTGHGHGRKLLQILGATFSHGPRCFGEVMTDAKLNRHKRGTRVRRTDVSATAQSPLWFRVDRVTLLFLEHWS